MIMTTDPLDIMSENMQRWHKIAEQAAADGDSDREIEFRKLAQSVAEKLAPYIHNKSANRTSQEPVQLQVSWAREDASIPKS